MPYPGIPQFYTPPAAPRDPNSGFGPNFFKSFMAGLEKKRRDEQDAQAKKESNARLQHLKTLIKVQEQQAKHEQEYGQPIKHLEELIKLAAQGGAPQAPIPPEAAAATSALGAAAGGLGGGLPGMLAGAESGGMIPPSVEGHFPPVRVGGETGFDVTAPNLEDQLAALAAEARAKRVPPTMVPTPPGAGPGLGPEVPENALPGILAALTPRAPEPMIDVGPIPGITTGGRMTPHELGARETSFTTRTHAATAANALRASQAKAGAKDWKAETDANGLFTGRQYNSAGEVREVPGLAGIRGKPLTGQAASRVHQAGVILDQGQKLIDELPAVAAKLGPVKGRAFKLTKLWGDPDPQVRKFAVELSSFVALQPALHGFRGLNALQEFEKIVGGTEQTPESLAAAIQGIMELGQTVYESGNAKKPGGRFTIIKVE